ncbi:hypothetical protein [Telmatospirillum sp.]|uniref:hypothetical protein n=1 Tax=Telmatospirillum sp. TaxID=2079197 RepID=UPI00284249E6|nr:hypothetical protein [Telmatospirillum sp.]MDR3438642.1 hypothetical protein [Telmatospirillum sp.]
MTQVDQVSTAIGVNARLNQQKTQQATLLREMASGTSQSSIANALAVPLDTEVNTIGVAQQNVAIAGNVLSTSRQALTSVSNNLTKMLSTATAALSAPAASQAVLAQQFNALAQQTSGFVANASVNGLNLVSTSSSPMTVNTTTEGGKITVNNEPSDAASLGVSTAGSSGWSGAAAINASITQVQSALNQVSATQARLAAAQNALQFASQVNQSSAIAAAQSQAAVSGADIAATATAAKTSQAQSTLAVTASTEENKLAKSVLALFKNR